MIHIDGATGSGGGQVLRTACGLAALTGSGCSLTRLRHKRPRPGLREQHLQVLRALGGLCNGTLSGDKLGSTKVEFVPGSQWASEIKVQVATAGSVGLVIQALLIPATAHPLQVFIEGGGTYGKWSPPVSYLEQVIVPLLGKVGFPVEIEVQREGFYPRGGARVKMRTEPARFRPLEIMTHGELLSVRGVSVASQDLYERKVASRQAEAARHVIKKELGWDAEITELYLETLNPGSGIQLSVETSHTVVGANALGEVGKRAEIVGEEAARSLVSEFQGGCVDSHATDQILPYLALAGGRIHASQVTDHTRTNACVIENFLPVRFVIEGNRIEVEPA